MAPIVDTVVAFDRLACLAHLVMAHLEVEGWYAVPFDDRAPIEEKFRRLVAPLLDGTLAASPSERRLGGKYVEMWSAADRLNAGWRAEGAALLEWALSLRSELPAFDRRTTETAFLEDLVVPSSRANKRARAQLRSREELDAVQADADRWWRRATLARPLYAALQTPTSTLSKKKRGVLCEQLDAPVMLFGKPYERLTFAEMSAASSIALERRKAIGWLLAGGAWDDANPESSRM